MIVEKQKARATLLYRRKRGIIISLIVVAALIVAAILVKKLVNTYPYEDIDGTVYYVKLEDKEFALFDENGERLPTDSQYGYYVTRLGTLVSLDAESGACETVAVVDTEDTETVGYNNHVLIFGHIEKKNISSIEVHNSHGEFSFARFDFNEGKPSNSGDFAILSSPLSKFDEELFASLYVSAGYTLSRQRIEDPIKDENGEFSEYGLIAQDRVDDEGDPYRYEPAYYIITDLEGNSHKLIIGDRLVTGAGYYAQYVKLDGQKEEKRDTVYVLTADIADSLLQPVESFVSPTIASEISLNNYYDVDRFRIMSYSADGSSKTHVGFSFIDLDDRLNTLYSSRPFIFDIDELGGYIPDTDAVFEALMNFYQTEFIGVKKLAPTEEDFVKYGLAKMVETTDGEGSTTETLSLEPAYSISFVSEILGDDGAPSGYKILQLLYISEKNEAGNYYVYSEFYDGLTSEFLYGSDMIVEVAGHCLNFVEWKTTKWINPQYIDFNIAYCEEISLRSPDYEAHFILDNSRSDQSQKTNTDLLEIHGKDSKGSAINTFSSLVVRDIRGFVWNITHNNITAYKPTGEEATISSAYYAYNALGRSVKVVSGFIEVEDGREVKVTADTVEVKNPDGSEVIYARYASTLFRLYYETLLTATIVDSYEMTPEEEAALIADPSKHLLTLKIKLTKNAYGNDSAKSYPDDYYLTYDFFRLTSRKAYIVVNGVGGFYVNTERLEKFASDSQKFFALEMINATDKN